MFLWSRLGLALYAETSGKHAIVVTVAELDVASPCLLPGTTVAEQERRRRPPAWLLDGGPDTVGPGPARGFVRAVSATNECHGPRVSPLMARPRTYLEPRRTTAVRLPASLHARLRAEADARLLSANLLIERAVTEFLDRLPPVQTGTEPR